MSNEEFWEQWVGSTVKPIECVKRHAKVREQDARRWINYRDEIKGTKVIVDMPDNAPTKSCDEFRHDACPHRLGQPQQGGVILKLSRPGFIWRCGCPCHRDRFAQAACSEQNDTQPGPASSPPRVGWAPFFFRTPGLSAWPDEYGRLGGGRVIGSPSPFLLSAGWQV